MGGLLARAKQVLFGDSDPVAADRRIGHPRSLLAGFTARAPVPTVSVAVPLQREVTDWDEFVGQFEAVQDTEVVSRASGTSSASRFAKVISCARDRCCS